MASSAPVRRAVVIGGGPAGSVAASLLARGGVEVTLIEQSRQVREKVCGECLSDLGWQALAQAGLLEPLERLFPRSLERARFIAAGGAEIDFALPARMWGLTRRALDAALLEAARAAGAGVRAGARLEHLAPGPLPVVRVRDLETNGIEQIRADVVLLADGKGLLPQGKPRPTADLGLKAHFTGVEAEPATIGLFGLRGHYVGLAPVSDGARVVWNLACSVPAKRVGRYAGDHEALLLAMRRENPGLDRALAEATRIGPWLSCPLPRFAVRRRWPEGIIPIGNAAAALEPIGGEGMGLAIASSVLAAQQLLSGSTWREAAHQLEQRFAGLWRTRRAACRAAALLLSRPRIASVAIRLAHLAPATVRIGVALAGKRKYRPGSFVGASRGAAGALSCRA